MITARPTRRHHSRIAQLEALLACSMPPEQHTFPQSEEEWLVQFQQWPSEGIYDQEPDFPWLLHRFEQAIQKAKESPSYYPPGDCITHLDEPGRLREWRNQWRFPELHRVFLAILTMSARALEGQPALTRAEWEQLKEWYQTERHRLPASCGAIQLPTGRSISQSIIDHELRENDGIIIDTAVRVLNDLRELHHHFHGEMQPS